MSSPTFVEPPIWNPLSPPNVVAQSEFWPNQMRLDFVVEYRCYGVDKRIAVDDKICTTTATTTATTATATAKLILYKSSIVDNSITIVVKSIWVKNESLHPVTVHQ